MMDKFTLCLVFKAGRVSLIRGSSVKIQLSFLLVDFYGLIVQSYSMDLATTLSWIMKRPIAIYAAMISARPKSPTESQKGIPLSDYDIYMTTIAGIIVTTVKIALPININTWQACLSYSKLVLLLLLLHSQQIVNVNLMKRKSKIIKIQTNQSAFDQVSS